VYTGFWWGNLRERDHLGDTGVYTPVSPKGNIIMDLQVVGGGGMDWIELAEDRDMWQALVNVVMKPSGSIKCGKFLD